MLLLPGIFAFLILDQVLKAWVVVALPLGHPYPVALGVLHLTYQQNTGAAFSILRDAPVFFLPIVTVGVLALFLYLASPYLGSRLGAWATVCICAGALGNLIDRVFRHSVVDYIDVHTGWFQYPVFNLADSLVVVGVGLLLITVMHVERRKTTAGDESGSGA
jgi:signal peptidase II